MSIIQWDERFLIGVSQLDEHHQHLFFLSNRFYDIFTSNAPHTDLSPLFDELIDYAIYHFAAEEELMHEYKFPELEMHKREHDTFSVRLVEMEKDFHADRKHLLIEVVVFLNNWLNGHILQSDAEFGRFITEDHKSVSRKGKNTQING